MEDLVQRAKDGNKDSYQELFGSVYGNLYKLAISILHSSADAEDAVQDTFLLAFKYLQSLKNNKAFKSWISKILKHRCYDIIEKRKNHIIEPLDDNSVSYDAISDIDAELNYKDMVKYLDPEEKEMFDLKYVDKLTIKEIAKRLNKTESAVKSVLFRGRQKLSRLIKQNIYIFIAIILITGIAIGACIYAFFGGLFETNSVGQNNDGMLYAVQNLDWYQEIDMDYIDVDENSKIKLSYISMDEMSLYMIFDFYSKKDISEYINLTFSDLKIIDKNNLLIYDALDHTAKQYSLCDGTKEIKNDGHNMRFLLYMYNDSFPKSKTLDISFSRIVLSRKRKIKEFIFTNCNINFTINLSEKFLTRNYTLYTSQDVAIEKAIISETGFYSIINLGNVNRIKNFKFLDMKNTLYPCERVASTYNSNESYKFIITSPFRDTSEENLRLIVNGKEYLLTRE